MILCPVCCEGAFRNTIEEFVTLCRCGRLQLRRLSGDEFKWHFWFGQQDPLIFQTGGHSGDLFFREDWMGRLSPNERLDFVHGCVEECFAGMILLS